MKLIVFIPQTFFAEKPAYIFGKVVYDEHRDVKKYYIIGVCETDIIEINKSVNLIGYYHSTNYTAKYIDKKCLDWMDIRLSVTNSSCDIDYYYHLENIISNNKKICVLPSSIIIIIYDQLALQETELFVTKTSDDHFYQLMRILQTQDVRSGTRAESKFNSVKKTLLCYSAYVYLLPVLLFLKITNKLLPILRYSSLGLHLNNWLENVKWTLINIIQTKRITLKIGNHITATIIDILLGILVLQLLLQNFNDTSSPSQVLLTNAEKIVESLKSLIHWLMGAPAGLKLNYAFNNILGKFFLYHIHLWWTFLIFITPVMDFAFEVLLLFGRLGVTFQISIASDLLALISFHTYCIYVYAARLFNIQLNAITSLFRLFLGKKKNPLRERVDSCQYKPDQLFVGTLLFTILLFLIPTTWVYYTVFTTLRLLLTGFSGLLARLRFYLQVTPVYAFIKWLFNSYCTQSSILIKLHSEQSESNKTITLMMTMVTSSWGQTWKRCIIDTIACHPCIEWSKIINSILWGHLIYPL